MPSSSTSFNSTSTLSYSMLLSGEYMLSVLYIHTDERCKVWATNLFPTGRNSVTDCCNCSCKSGLVCLTIARRFFKRAAYLRAVHAIACSMGLNGSLTSRNLSVLCGIYHVSSLSVPKGSCCLCMSSLGGVGFVPGMYSNLLKGLFWNNIYIGSGVCVECHFLPFLTHCLASVLG